MSVQPIIALTPGDPAGIGPEIAAKAIRTRTDCRILCVGAREPFEKLGVAIQDCDPHLPLNQQLRPRTVRNRPAVWLLPAPTRPPKKSQLLAGYQAGWAIETATRLVLSGQAQALVTGPVHKERLQQGGYPFPGHTEFLAKLCGVKQVTMMLANSQLRVSLVTIHMGIHKVAAAVTRASIRKTVLQTAEGLKRLWGIKRPRIAVAALNPHAGEHGLFGSAEEEIISPEIHALRKTYGKQLDLGGPFPADTLFVEEHRRHWDAVVCMYHDQGLIPVKMLDFARTVNITLGLPIIRTSVDHGVAFDIAGKGIASPTSLEAAIDIASKQFT